MSTATTHSSEKTTSWPAILTAILPFGFFGLALIFGELPHEWMIPSWSQALGGYLLIGTITLLPIGLCIGWIQGFPRWCYPYVGQFLLVSLYLMGQRAPSFLPGKQLLGWLAWIPLLVVAVVSLLVTGSLLSLKGFFTNIRGDWTLLTFAKFGFMPLVIAVIFDEMDRLYSLYFMVILTLLMVGTVIAYVRSSSQKLRIKALVIGVFLTIAVAVSGPGWFWFDRVNADPWPTVIAGIVVFLMIFSPALIGIFHKPAHTS